MEFELEEVKSHTNSSSTTAAVAALTSDGSSLSGLDGQLIIKKICSDCGTNKTPLWRGGPAGPKSLCNACGIRSRKRRRALLGLNKPEEKRCKKTINNSNMDEGISSDTSHSGEVEKKLRSNLKLTGLTWKRSTAGKQNRKLGEEEQAAVLLMAMAYNSVFA